MTPIATQTLVDPLAAFMAGARIAGTRQPVPLVATSFAVGIDAGLAVVETTRRFRNSEDSSIEATITFPLPVHATLFSLKARIGERTLWAHAEARVEARRTYEAAIESGKTAVLHEEVLRGVHMLTVGHVPPGAEIEVVTLWAVTATLAGNGATLRIPLTVGDIYGRSGLPDSDELVHAAGTARADLMVRSADGPVELIGGRLEDGRAVVPLNAPIDLRIPVWTPRTLTGRAADGREVALRVARPEIGEQPIDVAILVDHSGSMNDACVGAPDSLTKHGAVIDGLVALATRLGDADAVDLWEFDDGLAHVGSTHDLGTSTANRLVALAAGLQPPSGGTEIGRALSGVLQQSTARDILLITDGKSHALQVQSLAGAGRRITVVLVGEDSLEAHVGHLAALTGGDIFVAAGADLRDVMLAALATLRRAHVAQTPVDGELRYFQAQRGGAIVSAEWRPAGETVPDEPLGRAVASVAATLALPMLHVRTATELAVAEGLVSHLTSLVLVDGEGAVQPGLPGVRKLSLPTPRTGQPHLKRALPPGRANAAMAPLPMAAAAPPPPVAPLAAAPVGGARRAAPVAFRSLSEEQKAARTQALVGRLGGEEEVRRRAEADGSSPRVDLSGAGDAIDWDRAPNELLDGNLPTLDRRIFRLINQAAALPAVVALAQSLGIAPIKLVIALLAQRAAAGSRSAARIANVLLGAAPPAEVERVKAMLSL